MKFRLGVMSLDDSINRSRQLTEYLPLFMQQFKEVKEIMRVQDLEFERIASATEKVLNNAFIENCDEYGIKKYEDLLGIVISAEDTLETRKSRVLLRWNNEIPYTYRVLIAKLNSYCGVNNYSLQGDLTRYEVNICTHFRVPEQMKELENLLETILPMNIAFEIVNEVTVSDADNIYVSCIAAETICYKFSEGEV